MITELLNEALREEILKPGLVSLASSFPKAGEAYLKAHKDDPRLAELRKPGKKGPGAQDAARVKAAVAAWVAQLPRTLDAMARSGEVLALSCSAGKKLEPAYTVTPAGARAAKRSAASARLDRALAELEKGTRALRELLAAESDERPVDLTEALHDAYRALDASGRGYVPIHRLRAAVPAAREAFDEALRKLRRELVVDLQVGDVAEYSPEQLVASLSDPDGTLFLTLTWRR